MNVGTSITASTTGQWRKPRWRRIGLALGFLVVCGCGKTPVEFNNAIVQANWSVRAASQRFDDAVDHARKTGEAGDVSAALQSWLSALARSRRTVESLSPDSGDGRALRTAALEYLDTVESIVREDYAKVPSILNDETADDHERTARLRTIYDRASDREADAVTRLRAAQSAFAARHGLTLHPTQPIAAASAPMSPRCHPMVPSPAHIA